ncbi:MAG: hypothetical protein H6551_12695 [Chitinophagales bacterium]|nr:hypothetical protein [Chitinophagaceae bacterium]MCB9065990.1 hypothetical protein [Chitinophagales bacterium]
MKKSTILLALLAVVTFSACKKNYNCACTYAVTATAQGYSSSEEGEISKSIKDTKKKAEDECKNFESQVKSENDFFYSGAGVTVTSTANCTLK